MILDVTVGARKIYRGWDKKLNDPLIGIDVRKGDFSVPKLKSQWAEIKIVIEPTVLADMKHLPFQDNVFEAIIFDPPHMDVGLDTWLGKKWGSWNQNETIQTLRQVNCEFFRVLKKLGGFLILKVMPRQFPLYETLLTNFTFFLPIYTYRARGSFRNPKPRADAALWAIGKCKFWEANNDA